MSYPISKSDKWLAVWQQRRLANIEYWLDKLETCEELASFVLREYDNLLRTLESALQQDRTFDLAYRLIEKLSFVVFGYVDWDRWLVYLTEAVEISHRLQREAQRGFLMERICHIHLYRGDFQLADTLYRETAVIFQQLGEMESYAFTLSRLGLTTYELRQDLPESVALCNQAIELGHSSKNKVLVAHLYDALALIYQRARDWQRCLETAQTGYDLVQHSSHPRMKEHLLSRMVSAYVFLEEWEAVNDHAAELTEIFLTIGDIEGLSSHKISLGVAAFKQANYGLAESLWQEALSLQSQIQRPSSLAHISNNLGKVYTKLGEWDEAQDFLEKAISIFDELADMYSWANSMDNLVDLYEAQGRFEECRRVLEQVLTRLQDIDAESPVQKLLSFMRQRLQALPREC